MEWLLIGGLVLWIRSANKTEAAAKAAAAPRVTDNAVRGAPIFDPAVALAGRHDAVDKKPATNPPGSKNSSGSGSSSSHPGSSSGGLHSPGEQVAPGLRGSPHLDDKGNIYFSPYVFPNFNASDPTSRIDNLHKLSLLAELRAWYDGFFGAGALQIPNTPHEDLPT